MTDKLFKAVLSALISLALFLSCKSDDPVITSIYPKIGNLGDVITLTGRNFGEAREDAYITIAGIAPTGSSYLLWQDDMIMLRIPEMGESGLIYIHTRGKKSNGILFSNIATVPKPVDGEEPGFGPRIASINPQGGTTGSIIKITGSNFGISRENGGVFFLWENSSPLINPYAVNEPEFIEVSEIEMGYVSWNTREIQVRLPDGAVSGNVEVRTPHGSSRPVFFDVSGTPGFKKFTDKRTYTVSYSVDIRVLEASMPNTLYLWVPKPVISPSQRNISLISRSMEPFVENHKGVSLFKLDNLGIGSVKSINISYLVDVYSKETEINPQLLRQPTSPQTPSQTTPLSVMYTQSSDLIPVNSQQLRTTVNSIIGREQNPYLKARLIYNWIVSNIQLVENMNFPSGVFDAVIEHKQADSYMITLLYAAMARIAGIPCIPAAGILIDRSGQQTKLHYWAEFWLNDFGWVPTDPAAGTGSIAEVFISKEDPAGFYFGNMDNNRIAFSRGEIILSQMENRGRLVSLTQSYSLQNIWEEASGGLESYNSLWGDVIISGIYVQ